MIHLNNIMINIGQFFWISHRDLNNDCRILISWAAQIKTKDDEGITEIAQPMLSSSIVKLDISTEKI
jgi:hypothetical protein